MCPQNAGLQRSNLSSRCRSSPCAQRHKARFELMFERRVVLTSQAGEASSRALGGSTALFDKGAPRKTWSGTCLGKGHSVTRSA